MTDRPVNGDHPDFSPTPDKPENGGAEQPGKKKDDPGSAPESGDKEPE